MAEQLTFDLAGRPALGRNAFLVSPANAAALEAVDASATWPGGKLVLVGPEGAGKSHLAHVWARDLAAIVTSAEAEDLPLEASALVIEDVDRIVGRRAAEERVFHLHNAVLNHGGRLLVTGRTPPGAWPLSLPDLASRLNAAGLARLASPDEALLAGILVKLFADRHIRVKQKTLVPYLVSRIERSFVAAEDAVRRLDRAALTSGRPIGRKLAAEVLGL